MSEPFGVPPLGGSVQSSLHPSRGLKAGPRTEIIWGIFAAELLLSLLIQLPGIADFQKFAFYDEGAWLHLDQLFAQGARPTLDIGYSYGMLPLIAGRAWFALFGRTPWAFIGFITTCNLVAAWGFARIVHILGATWPRILLACILLPYAIFPNNYSLMHAFEMMLIILALSQQARGRYGSALALATLAVFTKPTMAYVLGFLLLLLAAWLRKGWRIVILPAIVGMGTAILELCCVGLAPLLNNLLPLTGGRSYRQMNFGFFRAGRDFWLHAPTDWYDALNHYVIAPPLFWLLGTAIVWALALWALAQMVKGHRSPVNALLVTLATLHATFVFAFYAWSGSWTYYSYLVVLGLLAGLPLLKQGRALSIALAAVALVGLSSRFGDGLGRWRGMQRLPESAGLWTYTDYFEEAQHARQLAADNHGLYLINGDLPSFWPEAQIPRCWFLSPGIQTPQEMQDLHRQIAAAGTLILCKDYDQRQEAWNWPEFAPEHAQFETLWESPHFRVLRRTMPAN